LQTLPLLLFDYSTTKRFKGVIIATKSFKKVADEA